MARLEVTGLTLRCGGGAVLENADLCADAGAITALVGGNRTVRSLLMRAIAGLEPPAEGTITLGGTPLFQAATNLNLAPDARRLGAIFPPQTLWPQMSIAENLAYPLHLRGVAAPTAQRRVTAVLAEVGLTRHAGEYPNRLTPEARQRAAVARALVLEPQAILLDDPLTGLDPAARALLHRILRDRGITSLCTVPTDLDAEAFADQIVQLAPRSALLDDGAAAIGSNNRLTGRVVGLNGARVTLETGGAQLTGIAQQPLTLGQPVVGVLRAEAVRCLPPQSNEGIPGQVIDALFWGERLEILCRVGQALLRAAGADEPPTSRQTRLSFAEDSLWIYRAPTAAAA